MKTTYFLLALALFLHLGTPPLTAQLPTGEGLPVIEKELPNGLRLLVLRRSGAPTVAFVTQYRVGSVHEEPGRSGIAHLLRSEERRGGKEWKAWCADGTMTNSTVKSRRGSGE